MHLIYRVEVACLSSVHNPTGMLHSQIVLTTMNEILNLLYYKQRLVNRHRNTKPFY